MRRKLSNEQWEQRTRSFLSAHVQTANVPLAECTPILIQLEAMLRDKYRIGHSTFQFECDEHRGKCSEIDGLYCQMGEDGDHDHADEHLSITPVEKG